MRQKAYPSDLTDAQWALLEPMIPPARPGGHPRTTDVRAVVNALLYRNRNGVGWRALPHDFPHWRTVYEYFRAWAADGTWEKIHDALARRLRTRAGRRPAPSAASIDNRRRMRQRLDKRYGRYGQRAQAETGFSMFKRRLGSVVRARSYWAQCRELLLMAITYDLMLL